MKNAKIQKRALFTSLLALLLCCTMLVGTTLAWFTDSVESGINKIVAGNLDVEVYDDNDLTDTNKGTKITSTYELFKDTLWEPGKVVYKNIRVANEGTLAFKYRLMMDILGENTVIEADDTATNCKLSDVVKIAYVEGGITGLTSVEEDDRQTVLDLVGDDFSDIYSTNITGIVYPEDEKDEIVYGIVLYWEPRDDDNNWNLNNGKYAFDVKDDGTIDESIKIDYLMIKLGLSLTATQVEYETDSFGPNYDKNTTLPAQNADKWVPDDTHTTPLKPETDPETGVETNEYIIKTAAELAQFAKEVNAGNNFSGKAVKLAANINLDNQPWTPISGFKGTFDGQGYTIYNLNISATKNAGLFGAGIATLTNIKIDTATVQGNHFVGVIAAYNYGNITNCTVDNATVIAKVLNDNDNGDKVGGIVGYVGEGTYTVSGNTVKNSTIIAGRDVGGIVGASGGTTLKLTNNIVEKVDIYYSIKKDYVTAGEIISQRIPVNVDDSNIATDDVTITLAQFISTAAELIALGNNSYEGMIVLENDINLNGASIATIGAAYGKELNVIGNGHTISNAKVIAGTHNGMNNYGLFYAYTNSKLTISNLLIQDVTVTATVDNYGAAVVIGYTDGGSVVTLNNVDVKNSSAENSYDEAAVYVGYQTGTLIMNDCDSIGCTVKGETAEKTGAFIGHVNGVSAILNNCSTDLTIGATNRSNGTIVINGGSIPKDVSDDNELDNAISAGYTEINLGSGTYIIPDTAKGKTLTIVGNGDTVIATQDDGSYEGCDYSLDGATVTFDNITINTDSTTYTGYARLNATYNNCTINGTYTLYGDSVFNDCTFNVSGDVYNIWTWGAPNATFNNCTFNSDGKALLLYGTVNTNLTVNNCVFNDMGGLTDLKAAIEIGNDYGKSYTLTVNNTTVNGYEINDKGINTDSTLWANKNSMSTDNLNVVIDGVDVY